MAQLPEPMEILDLADGESRSFRATGHLVADATIKTTREPGGKAIQVLRVFVRKEDKPLGPPYWDVTGKTLVADLLPQLQRPDLAQLRFTVTARGIAPKKRFQLEVTK